MSRSAWLQLSELCDSETAISALNALAEGLFLLEPGMGTCRPLNAAAAAMVVEPNHDAAADLPLDRYFPDFNFSAALDFTDRSHLAHFPSLRPSGACDVHVQFRRLTGDGQGVAKEQLLAIVRPIGVKTSAGELSPRDAFDDGFHDSLTRLPNRQLFARRLERAIRRGATSQYHFAVLFVDLDHFKAANDRFGHLLGDRLLVAAAHRLVESVRPQDMVARRDGDEFTILLDDLDRPEDAAHVADRIVEHLNAPFHVDGPDGALEIKLGASVGVAQPGGGLTASDELISHADAAMYQAKSLGGGTFAVVSGCGSKPKPR